MMRTMVACGPEAAQRIPGRPRCWRWFPGIRCAASGLRIAGLDQLEQVPFGAVFDIAKNTIGDAGTGESCEVANSKRYFARSEPIALSE
jgi:hypothetical protein